MKKTTILFLLSLALVMVFASGAQTAMLFKLDFGQNGTFEDYWEMQPNGVVEVDIYVSNVPFPGLLSIGMDLVYDPLQLQVAPESAVDIANWHVAPQIKFEEGKIEIKGGRLLPALEGDRIKVGTLELKCINPGLSELWIYDSDRQGSYDDFVLSDGTVLDGELEGGILVANVNNVVSMHLDAGWNMISLPVNPTDKRLKTLFPGAVVVYGYEKGEGYVRIGNNDDLAVGRGYWILLNQNTSYTLTGNLIQSDTHPASSDGWLMIGGCTDPAKVISSGCDVGVIYGYTQGTGYQRVTGSLEPGKGYWILLNNVDTGATISVETVD